MPLPLDQALTRLVQNEENLEIFINGNENQTYVTRDGTQVPSIRKFLADLRAQIIGIADEPTPDLFADLFVQLSNKVNLGNTKVIDANYVAKTSDVQITFTALSQDRTVEMPNITDVPYGQDILIADVSNSAAYDRKILIVPKAGSTQIVGDGTGLSISNKNQAIRLRRASDTVWMIA